MAVLRNEIETLILDALREIGELFRHKALLKSDRDTVIYGPKGTLDSLGLVRFTVSVEQKVQSKFGKQITLVDEKALSQVRSPFAAVSTLAEYVENLLR